MSSIYIIPTEASYRPQQHTFGRCGPSAASGWQFDPFGQSNAIRRFPFGPAALFEDEVDDGDYPFAAISRHHHIEQLRRQQRLEEFQRRRAIQQRQQQIEQERAQRERALRRERAIRLAWQREQERRAAVAEAEAAAVAAAFQAHQQRIAAHRRQQQEQYAERRRQAEVQQREWQKVAQHSLFGFIDLVEQFFSDEKEGETAASTSSRKEEKKPEQSTESQEKAQASGQMQVDEAPQEVPKETTTSAETTTPAVPQVEPSALQSDSTTKETKETKDTTDRLIFTYPLPADEAARSQIRAEDVQVHFDEASRTIQLAGLWPQDSHNDAASSASSTVSSGGESRGRKRSRSPKRSRVSDVDEKTGEEIVKADDDEEYVEVSTAPTTGTPVQKSIRLPDGASVNGLRAEITDDGFKVWVQ